MLNIKKLAALALLAMAGVAGADVTVDETLSLTEDLDWRDQGTVTIADGVRVKLNGHTLKLSGLAGNGAIVAGEYSPLEYIEATGAQYINSGVINNTDPQWGDASVAVAADLAPYASGYQSIVSSCYYDNKNAVGLWTRDSKWTCVYNNNWYDSSTTIALGTRYMVTNSWSNGSQVISVDGVEVRRATNAGKIGNTGIPLYICARNNGNNKADNFARLRLYSLKIFRPSNKLVRDYVPVERVQDGAIGLYDKLNGTFSPSETATPFVAGPYDGENDGGYGGELHLDVPSGTLANSSVTLRGTFKVVKLGAGTYSTQKSQTYSGGTFVDAGKVRSTVAAGFGKAGTTVKVASGAQVLYDGGANWQTLTGYHVDIAGTGPDGNGALYTTARNGGYNYDYLESLTLSADATVKVTTSDSLNLFANSGRRLPFTLNGHTLTLAGNGRNIVNNVDVIGDGDILVTGGPFYAYAYGATGGIFATNSTFTVAAGALYDGEAQMTVKNFVFNGTWNADRASLKVTALERYTPGATYSGVPQVVLGDAEHPEPVLDLGGLAAVYNGGKLIFPADTTVVVDVGSRNVAAGDQLVSWTALPDLSVGFTLRGEGLDPAARGIGLVARTNGLFVRSTAAPVYAEIDLSGETPQWLYFMENGSAYPGVWTEGVTADIQVRFGSYAEYVAIKAQNVTPASFRLTGFTVPEGTATLDMSSGMDFVFEPGAVFDVKGNVLKLPNAMISGDKPFTVTSSVEGGELVVDVPANESLGISQASLAGALKLRKTGEGKFYSWKAQTYTGGTEIDGGTAMPPNPTAQNNTTYCWDQFKAFGTGEIVVNEGATFDLRAQYAYRDHVVLAGGKLVQSGPYHMTSYSSGGSGIGRLTADSSMDLAYSLVFNDPGSYTDLAGHTLTVGAIDGIAANTHLYMRGGVTNGTFDVVTGSFWLNPVGTIDMSTTVAKLSCALDFSLGGMSVKDYVARYTQIYNNGNNELKVYGTFRPEGVAGDKEYFYGCTMQDGSTIDLSAREGTWKTTSDSNNRNTVTFVDNATVTIDVHGRTIQSGTLLVEWVEAPENLEGLTFRLDDASRKRGYQLKVKEDGLHVYCGMVIVVR